MEFILITIFFLLIYVILFGPSETYEDPSSYEKYDSGYGKWNYYDKYEKSSYDDNYRYYEYDDYKKTQERKKQDQLASELAQLQQLIISDFTSAPYSDKIETPTLNGQVCWEYTFEDKTKVKIIGKSIYYIKNNLQTKYTVTQSIRNDFVALANAMNKKTKHRYNRTNYNYTNNTTPNTETKDPKRKRYDSLLDKINLREQQLKTCQPDERQSLTNELNVYKKKANEMKVKYNF